MAVRKFSEAIIRNCIRHIADLARFLRRSLDTAIAEYVRRFQVRMIENSARPPKRNSAILVFNEVDNTGDGGSNSNGLRGLIETPESRHWRA